MIESRQLKTTFERKLFVHNCLQLQALFIASGPSFKANLVIDGFENIEIYNLIAGISCHFLDAFQNQMVIYYIQVCEELSLIKTIVFHQSLAAVVII